MSISTKLAAVFLGLSGGAAQAADAAYPQALGFSQDGTRFAFLEWGVQDGSGFSYANAYVVDLAKDAWLASPVRVVIEDEYASPMLARDRASDETAPHLSAAGIDHPARLIHARPFDTPTETDADSIAWRSPVEGVVAYEFLLERMELKAEYCSDQTYGFSLSWNGTEIYRDTSISRSRGCPYLYSVERVFIPDFTRPQYAVALIGVHSYGFEGMDMRHIAIPIPLDRK